MQIKFSRYWHKFSSLIYKYNSSKLKADWGLSKCDILFPCILSNDFCLVININPKWEAAARWEEKPTPLPDISLSLFHFSANFHPTLHTDQVESVIHCALWQRHFLMHWPVGQIRAVGWPASCDLHWLVQTQICMIEYQARELHKTSSFWDLLRLILKIWIPRPGVLYRSILV